MPVNTVSEVPTNPHVVALRQKHDELSRKVDEARKNISIPDMYLSQLKKEKLLIKEKLAVEEKQTAKA
ncbi:MAG: DUF465 domain-containing protein [Alphaproteobacteria bacterium]